MAKWLLALSRLPYGVAALILGVALIVFPCVTINKDFHFSPQAPASYWPVAVGIGLLILSAATHLLTQLVKQTTIPGDVGAGLDLSRVTDSNGVLSTTVSGCEIRVIAGRIEDYNRQPNVAMVLPCNEYFDDRCAGDTSSALGSYVSRVFEGQAERFVSLVKSECRKQLGPGVEMQKTFDERAESFGAGRCVLLEKPLGHSVPVALVSTTTQRAGEGLSARISYLFNGMREMRTRLADTRIREVAMPVLGAGHGRIDAPLTFVGLALAVAEAAYARFGASEGQFLKRVTIIVFKEDANSVQEVDQVVIRRALALITPKLKLGAP